MDSNIIDLLMSLTHNLGHRTRAVNRSPDYVGTAKSALFEPLFELFPATAGHCSFPLRVFSLQK